jgi:hypothetical protein
VKPAGILGTRAGISDELSTNNDNKNIRDLYREIKEFKRGYKPRSTSE